MNYILNILRRRREETKSYRQRFLYEPVTEGDTVATALTELNKREVLADTDGTPAGLLNGNAAVFKRNAVPVPW